jgi:hypothetical protein
VDRTIAAATMTARQGLALITLDSGEAGGEV